MLFNPSSLRLGRGVEQGSVHLPPANCKIYLPLLGVSAAWQTEEQPHAGRRTRSSPAQKAGVAYQRRVGEFLSGGNSHWRTVASPWFAYCDMHGGKRRYCQPDFLLVDDGNSTCVIVEAKLTWTPEAWWQLERLYRPVIAKACRWETLLCLCISRGYDPAFPAPTAPTFVDDVYDIKPNLFNFLIFK